MFPRGYFKRVAAFVGWLLVAVAAILGMLQLFRANGNNEGDESWLLMNLWKCDCRDENTHTDPEMHTSGCAYYIWYNEQAFRKGGEDE